MKNEVFLILVLICSSTHCVRSAYEILKHRKLLNPGRLSFVIVFTDMAILWISWLLLCSFDPSGTGLPHIFHYIGITLTGAGIIVFLTGLFTIKTLESYDGDLITTGIYSAVRHPIYLGFIFWLTGLPLIHGGLISLILSLPYAANIMLWRYLEEKELEIRFPSYPEYRKKTLF